MPSQPDSDSKNKPRFRPVVLRTKSSQQTKAVGISEISRANQDLAQQLVYEAMDARTEAQSTQLMLQALELDPGNVDALLAMIHTLELDTGAHIEALRTIVDAGARRLGPKVFKEMAPHFWGFHETRPYMRARQKLAEELRSAGRLEEAATEYGQMLVLNEGDNQGVRYHLLPCLLALGRLEEARRLMDQFEGERGWSVVFCWGLLLERLLAADDEGAKKALLVARKQNPHMEPYLTGKRKLPKRLPGYYSSGSKDEALSFAEPLLMAFTPHPVARDWLLKQKK